MGAGIRLVLAALCGIGLQACAPELECGEQSLPGTEACPCLPGGVCAADLVCQANLCYARSVDRPEDDGEDDGDDTPGGTDEGTGSGSTDDDADSESSSEGGTSESTDDSSGRPSNEGEDPR